MKLLTEITTRQIDPSFGETPVRVREFRAVEPVPHLNSKPHPDGSGLYADVTVAYTNYEFEHAGLHIKRPVTETNGVETLGKVFELKIQASDAYRFQREFSLQIVRRYNPSNGVSTWHWEANTYLHPFHRVGGQQKVTHGVADRFIERLLDLVENYPSLVFNNEGYTSHTPPHFRPRHEGFVLLHTRLLNGAGLSVRLLG